MDREILLKQLEKVELNIYTVKNSIKGIETAAYYKFHDKKQEKQHNLEIQNKCLIYWKRKFNHIALQLMYKF